MSVNDREKYWAAQPLAEFLPALFERIDHHFEYMAGTGLLSLYRASHAAAYSGFFVGGKMNSAGSNGKFTALEANEYRNLATHVLNMVTSQKSQPEAQAKNLDHASQQQTVVANGLAETLSEEKQLERIRQDVAERGLYYGEGWGVPIWNKDLGEVYTVEQERVIGEDGQPETDEMGQPKLSDKPLHAGDIEYHSIHPLDMIRDVTRPTAEGHRWRTPRRYVNRYDLMALYPQYAEKIKVLPSAIEAVQTNKRPRLYQEYESHRDDCDDVCLYEFMHDRCPALPGGRIVLALSEELALIDDDLPYRELPHIRWSASDIEGTPFGYSLFFDLLALQQGINAGVSAIATRVGAFAVPVLWSPDGSPLNVHKIPEGLMTLEGGQVEPKLLDFSAIPESLIGFIKMLREFAATYSGINNVARGQPEGGITAASALALLEARAIQFVALSQKADIEFMKRMFTYSLWHYQDHAKAPFLVRMSGANNRGRVSTFMKKPEDINSVSGFTMKIGSALQGTTAGRMQLIEGAKASGVTMTTEQYWQVMTTGRLDPVTQGPQKEQEQIQSENEALTNGEEVTAILTDNHPLHIQEHCVVLADPESRKDANLVQSTLSHIQEHEGLWVDATMNAPSMLAAKGIPPAPLPMPPPGMVPPGAPGATDGTPPPRPGSQSATGPLAEQMPGAPPVKVEKAMPAKNPVTGMANGPTAVA